MTSIVLTVGDELGNVTESPLRGNWILKPGSGAHIVSKRLEFYNQTRLHIYEEDVEEGKHVRYFEVEFSESKLVVTDVERQARFEWSYDLDSETLELVYGSNDDSLRESFERQRQPQWDLAALILLVPVFVLTKLFTKDISDIQHNRPTRASGLLATETKPLIVNSIIGVIGIYLGHIMFWNIIGPFLFPNGFLVRQPWQSLLLIEVTLVILYFSALAWVRLTAPIARMAVSLVFGVVLGYGIYELLFSITGLVDYYYLFRGH